MSSIPPEVPVTPIPPAPLSLARTIVLALGDGLRIAFFLPARFRPGARLWGTALALLALVVLLDAGVQTRLLWPHAAADFSGLPGELFPFMLLIACAVGLSSAQSSREPVAQLACGLFAIWFWTYTCTLALGLGWPHLMPHRLERFVSWVPFDTVWTAVAALVWSWRSGGRGARIVALSGVVMIVLFVIPMTLGVRSNDLVQDTALASEEALPPGLDEATLYGEGSLLDDTLDAIRAGAPGHPTLYFVGFAGSDANTVFMKEVQSIRADFQSRYGTAHHDAILINEFTTAGKVPLATATSLAEVLKRIGEVMDPERDTLFLYLSSHGSEESGVSVSLHGLDLDDLDPKRLKDMLDDAHIKNRVIVVSACHAGIFIPVLKDPDTIVMAAAAADKTSFGCSNELDYTYFGRALFVDGLSRTRSFTQAFQIALPVIAAREKAIGESPSNPQISVGARLSAYLDTLYPPVHDPAPHAPPP